MISPPIALDTDGDNQTECIVFYHLDADQNTGKIATVGGVVYRRDRGGPPRWVYPCPLNPPLGSDLGEHTVSARAEDVLSGTKGLELIVEDRDQAGIVVKATLFGWNDSLKNDHSAPPDLSKMSYQLLGVFRSESGVEVTSNSVTVTDTATMGETRSRLAYRKVYAPTANNIKYCLNDTCKLVDPKETEVVALTECKEPRTTCYPEQTVLDFYRSVTGDDVVLEELVMPEALKQLKSNQLQYGCTSDRAKLEHVSVQKLDVIRNGNQPQIRVEVRCRPQGGSPKDSKTTTVTWTLEKYDGKWRLKSSR